MIPSIVNPKLTREEVMRFLSEMSRRMSGNLTPLERDRTKHAEETYNAIIKNNGGKNSILGY